jgi:hypothetical protein
MKLLAECGYESALSLRTLPTEVPMLLHKIRLLGLAALLIGSLSASLEAADVKVLLTQGRTAYQTNERIDLAVVRSAAEALPAGDLALTLAGEDGSKLAFSFAAPPVAAAAGGAKRTEHLHLSGWLLRPGKYTVEVAGYSVIFAAPTTSSSTGAAPRRNSSSPREKTTWATTCSTAATPTTTKEISSALASTSCPAAR